MRRLIDYHLQDWKNEEGRNSLLIRGARQVGKTYAVRQLAKSYPSFVEINLEENRRAATIFEPDLDPVRMTREIALLTGQAIIPGETLLFLDEIQAFPRAITALRYFYEEMPDLHVVAAGSLIDFAVQQVGMPVGRVTLLPVRPMSFMEFLCALGKQYWAKAIMEHSIEESFFSVVHDQLLDLVGQYLAVGGMPEAVKCWRDAVDPNQCFEVHQKLLSIYRQDFSKYAKKTQLKYVDLLFNQVTRQVGHRFKCSAVDGDYRKRELAPCLDLLCMSGIVRKVFRTVASGFPLGGESYLEDFKAIFLDTALGQAVLGHDLRDWILTPHECFSNKAKAAFVEAFVGQELLCYLDPRGLQRNLYYWRRAQRTSLAEVDYVCSDQRQLIPVEVKEGSEVNLRSLRRFLGCRPQSLYGVRFSTRNYSVRDDIHSYPLYAVAKKFGQDLDALRFLLEEE